jgi:hypothetical protein
MTESMGGGESSGAAETDKRVIPKPAPQPYAWRRKTAEKPDGRTLPLTTPSTLSRATGDFNVRNYEQFVEKLRYIHRNPVKRGLCERPEDWVWSSFCHYQTGTEGVVEIESDWTANKRERAAGRLCPLEELPRSSQERA